MSERTRSAYVKSKRSAPPDIHDDGEETRKLPKDNDVPFVRLVPTQPYIPAPGAIALRDIKQMEMGVENTQEENSLKEKSGAASTRSSKSICYTVDIKNNWDKF
uniref:Uncharacterized protein n=1 Tax=Panagrolaimus sp. ES5 TaxID=591445 RepID=A0AC34G2Q7_9BILA